MSAARAERQRSQRIEVLASCPGRLSLRYAAARDRPRLCLSVETALAVVDGVNAARAEPLTGRVLVYFDAARATANGLIAAVLAARPLTPAEVEQVLAARGRNAAAADGTRLVLGGVVLGGLLLKRLLLGAGMFSGSPVLFAVSAAATIISGYPFLRGGMAAFGGREDLNTDALIATATVASLFLRESVTALVVIWLLNLGEYLQDLTVRRVHRAIEELLTVGGDRVWLVTGGVEVQTAIEAVAPGDVVAVHTGETIPVDGRVVMGSAAVNEAPITGESLPAYKNAGDQVFAGTIVEGGSLRVEATRVGRDTAVGRLIARIEQARELRAPIETVAARFSSRFVPLSFALSLAVLLLTGDARRAVTMLVIACPCAAGLSTPTAVSAAIGNAARRGILIKGGVHLEAAASLDTIVFDKTGTLTTGRARVTHVLSLDRAYTPETVLQIAASGELHSQHPLALAVLRRIAELEVVVPDHEQCEVIVGRGMRAALGADRVLVGSERLMREFGVAPPPSLDDAIPRFRARGETILYVAINETLIGLIGIRDVVRPEAKAALQALRQAGIERFILLTGDSADTAAIVAAELGLAEFVGEVLPEEKFALIERLKREGHRVAMVGDGINDAPALARADLGIALGTTGADVAVEAADVALARDDVRDVATVLHLSRHTLNVVRQNYALSLGVNAAGLLFGAAGTLTPVLAAVLHNASTVAVVGTSSRLIVGRER